MNETEKHNPIASLPNPFDFANPVSKRNLFIGREDELKDIKYYLDHAKTADRAINLALLGERAAGKTSLLNIIEIEANDRGLVPVRINLNESDVETHMAFWFKVFDTVISRIVNETKADESGLSFGGPHGGTYDTYLDLTSAYDIPNDKSFCPFLFPVRYAKAMDAGKCDVRVSDQIIERDLGCIAKEIERPIVLLIDECNILSSERALLEMVRNTFMNLPGFMLVFTGTPDLFPLMDEVFSPIVRQFKRIEVTPFADISETHKAIMGPLRKVNQEKLFDTVSQEFIDSMSGRLGMGVYAHEIYFREGYLSDLHALTNGRPYEIQLVCHFMFKRVQLGRDKKMRLSIEVLEDVLNELRQSHDEDDRPVISAVKRLDEEELRRLNVLLASAGKIPVNHLFLINSLFVEFDQNAHNESRTNLVEQGVLEEIDGAVKFTGDDFDRIVCKYAAKQRGIDLEFDKKPIKVLLRSRAVTALNGAIEVAVKSEVRVRPLFRPFIDAEEQKLDALWSSVEGLSLFEFAKTLPEVVGNNYSLLWRNADALENGVGFVRLSLNYDGLSDVNAFIIAGPTSEEIVCIDQILADAKQHAAEMDGVFEFDIVATTGGALGDCLAGISESGDNDQFAGCLEMHCRRMVDLYLEKEDGEAAFNEAMLITRMDVTLLDSDSQNNVAYILLVNGEKKKALQLLELASNDSTESEALINYNLGVAHLLEGRLGDSIRRLKDCVAMESGGDPMKVSALLRVRDSVDGLSVCGRVSKEDEDELSLLDEVQNALAIASRLASSQ